MYINYCDNAEKEYKKRMNHFKTILKKNNEKNKNKQQKKRNNCDLGTQR